MANYDVYRDVYRDQPSGCVKEQMRHLELGFHGADSMYYIAQMAATVHSNMVRMHQSFGMHAVNTEEIFTKSDMNRVK